MFIYDIDLSIHEYVNSITTIQVRLKAISVEILNEDVIDILIYAFTPEHDVVTTSLMQSATTLTNCVQIHFTNCHNHIKTVVNDKLDVSIHELTTVSTIYY